MIALESVKQQKKCVLIGSPIYQKSEILKEFLVSLEELDKTNLRVDYLFVDDNEDSKSKRLLEEFREHNKNVTILSSESFSKYISDDVTHRWTEELIQKVARFKNQIIEVAKKGEYDYLFLIDSDIVLHPKTLKQLISDKKDIVANIFWTQWEPNTPELPQVWVKDTYSFYDNKANKLITQDEINKQTVEFVEMLRKPGVYRVGGLGACTMISRMALLKGVNFNTIYNISFWGEDRHFCIRAVAMGLELFVDTYYPAYHIYRSEKLAGIAGYKVSCKTRETEVLDSVILKTLVKGINSVMTYSYEVPIEKEFLEYFTVEQGENQLAKLNEERLEVEKQKIINRGNVMECAMNFTSDCNQVMSKIKLCRKGFKKGYSYYEELESFCELTKQEDGVYRISQFEIKNKLPLDNIPLVRRISEKPTITLSMLVKNEGGRYLERMLKSANEYIDYAVIVDDGSTDNTVAICKEILGDKLTLIQNAGSQFANETIVRKQQWYETISTNPDWILFLDADEIFEDRAKDMMKELIKNYDIDVYAFRLYDFWNEDYYREDKLWFAHHTFRPFMMRYQPNYNYTFTATAQHCGRMPNNVMALTFMRSDLRLKHYGWAKVEDRVQKYKRYMELDPEGKYGNLAQYESILDEQVSLIKWNE